MTTTRLLSPARSDNNHLCVLKGLTRNSTHGVCDAPQAAYVDYENKAAQTALMVAITAGEKASVSALMTAGAQVRPFLSASLTSLCPAVPR